MLLTVYVLQTTPYLFALFGVKPLLLIPASVCIALHEGELAGGLYGALAGILCDTAGRVFFGYYSILLLAACAGAGLLIIYMMNLSLPNAVLICFVCAFCLCSLEYVLMYGMWNYEKAELIYLRQTLPTVLYTTVVTPVLYFVVRRVHFYFKSKEPV